MTSEYSDIKLQLSKFLLPLRDVRYVHHWQLYTLSQYSNFIHTFCSIWVLTDSIASLILFGIYLMWQALMINRCRLSYLPTLGATPLIRHVKLISQAEP
jgi:hypothetical protein